jgi:hypothetical protein
MQHRGVPRSLNALLLVLASATAAQAAPETAPAGTPAQTEAAIAPALQRELARAAETATLARYHIGVLVEPRATRWAVSLVDLSTGKIVASTEIAVPSPDRDDAVAAVLRAVTELVRRFTGHRPRPAPPAEPPEPGAPPRSDSPSSQNRVEPYRQNAEWMFRQRALRFGPGGDQHWQVFRGSAEQELDAPAFYHEIGRDDLADAYHRRHHLMLGGYIVAGAAFAISGVLAVRKSDWSPCNGLQGDAFSRCADAHTLSLVPAIAVAGFGLIATGFASYYARNPQPIDEHDAKALADAYNQRLRRELGLPAALRRPTVRDLVAAPYLTGRDLGLALAGTLSW